MFGRMMVEPVVQLDPGVDLQTAIATLIKVAENVEIVRWIEFPAVGPAVLARARRSGFWGGLCPRPQERNLVRRGLRGRTIRRVQRKPARNAPEGL